MAFEKDDKVKDTYDGKIGRITGKTQNSNNNTRYEVDFGAASVFFVPEKRLELIDEQKDMFKSFADFEFAGITDFKRIMFKHRLSGQLTNMMYSMNDSSADFMPHQFKPVIKFLESKSTTERLLIADEVGLGKTIEAIYIWKEIVARRNARRLLVVSPAMLTEKWKHDLHNFFDIKAEIVKAETLMEHINNAIEKPLKENFILITSLEGIRNAHTDRYRKSSQLNALLENIADNKNKIFDLVIIDEAHYLRNRSTASFKTGERLRDTTASFVLLSATPIQTGSKNLFNLLNLMSPEDYPNEFAFDFMLEHNQNFVKLANAFDKSNGKNEALDIIAEMKNYNLISDDIDLQHIIKNIDNIFTSTERRIETVEKLKSKYFYDNYITRSRKRDVYEKMPIREAKTWYFEFSPFEKEIYDRVTVLLKSSHKDGDSISIFRLIARQRQMASSLPAAFEAWKNSESMQEMLYEDFGIVNENDETDSSMELDKLEFSDINIEQLKRHDSKYEMFRDSLKKIISHNPKEKIIVFSFFRHTISYLYERLNQDKISSVCIMGGMGDDKNKEIEQFRDNASLNVLISSEVGSEGIDLQFASIEINYDLPWNPMRLEQRIGRIDRIAQKAEKIQIRNMICQSTIEDRILEKLYERIEIFKTSIGDIEEILGNTIEQLAIEIFNPDLTEEQIQEKAEIKINAIAKTKLANEKLEEQAGNLTAHRDFILQSVNEAHSNKRYVTPEELMFTVKDFLNEKYPGSKTRHHTKHKSCLEMNLSTDARNNLRNYVRENNFETVTHLANYQSDIICCFDKKEKIKETKSYEVIDITHPLIKWIAYELNEKMYETKNCSCLSLNQKENEKLLPSGLYTYYIQMWKSEGAKKKIELKFFMGNISTGEMVDSNRAERVMQVVLSQGDTYESLRISDNQFQNAKKSLQAIYDNAWNMFDNFCEKEKSENEALIARQIYYTNHVAEAKINKIHQQIEEMKYNGASENILRMHRGRCDKIDAERDDKISELNKKRNFEPVPMEIAVGILNTED